VRLVALVIWGVLVACAAGLETVGRLGLAGLSPLGPVLATLRSKLVGRAVLIILWAWFGWHVFAR
jgi:hypothetical protein